MPLLLSSLPFALGLALDPAPNVFGQVATSRNAIQFAYNQPSRSQAPQPVSADRYFNDFEFVLTNFVLRLTHAPANFEDRIGSGHFFSPVAGRSSGVAGGAADDTYDGAGTGAGPTDPSLDAHPTVASPRIYSPINPDRRMPLTGVIPWEPRYDQFQFPRERTRPFLLTGLSRSEQPRSWQIGGDELVSYVWRNQVCRFGLRGGRSFFQAREGYEGNHCVGVLFRWELGKRKPAL